MVSLSSKYPSGCKCSMHNLSVRHTAHLPMLGQKFMVSPASQAKGIPLLLRRLEVDFVMTDNLSLLMVALSSGCASVQGILAAAQSSVVISHHPMASGGDD